MLKHVFTLCCVAVIVASGVGILRLATDPARGVSPAVAGDCATLIGELVDAHAEVADRGGDAATWYPTAEALADIRYGDPALYAAHRRAATAATAYETTCRGSQYSLPEKYAADFVFLRQLTAAQEGASGGGAEGYLTPLVDVRCDLNAFSAKNYGYAEFPADIARLCGY